MECPVCGSGELSYFGAYSHEPHGETHSDVGLRCLRCGAVSDEAECLVPEVPEIPESIEEAA